MPTDIPKKSDLFHFMMTLKFSYTKNFFPSSPSGKTKYASKFLFGSFSPFAFKTPNSDHSDNFLETSIFFCRSSNKVFVYRFSSNDFPAPRKIIIPS